MSSVLAPNPKDTKYYCPECLRSGYKIPVLRLNTYGSRDSYLYNVDDKSRHTHKFNLETYLFNTQTKEEAEIPKKPLYNGVRARGRKYIDNIS